MGFLSNIGKIVAAPFTAGLSLPGGGPLGSIFGGGGKDAAGNALNAGQNSAVNAVQSGTNQGKQELASGTNQAQTAAKTGFQKAADTATAGYNKASSDYATGGNQAVDTAKQGYAAANAQYNTPEMVTSRQELYQRAQGLGGLQPDVVNQMEGKAREEYGTNLRDVSRGLSQFAGDSQAGGLAGENYAKAATTLSGTRANTIRDIETQNEQLKRTEQGNAISSIQNEAFQRAGLNAQEAQAVSGLQEKIAAGGANLTAQETNAISQLAAQEGTTSADLYAKLGAGNAQLSSDEAKALAEIFSQTASNQATLATTKTGPLGLW